MIKKFFIFIFIFIEVLVGGILRIKGEETGGLFLAPSIP